MSDVPVYMVVNLKIIDEETYLKYAAGFFPLLEKYGGRLITFDDNAETFEGDAPHDGRMVIFQFPSEEQVRAWYNDPDYQAISEYRRRSAPARFVTMIRGMPQEAIDELMAS